MEKVLTAPPVARPKSRAAHPEAELAEEKPVRAARKARATIAVHSFPPRKTVVEPHILKSGEAISVKPMTCLLYTSISYLPQEPSVFRKLTVEENILAVLEAQPLGSRERRIRSERLIHQLNLGRCV